MHHPNAVRGPWTDSLDTPRVLMAILASWLLLSLAPAAASAAANLTVGANFPSVATIGEGGGPATVSLTNTNTGPDGATTICNAGDIGPCTGAPGITVIPSCAAVDFSSDCTAPGADPGVFAVEPTGVGAAGSVCAGRAFAVNTIDAASGKVRIAPTVGSVVLPSPGSMCVITLTVSALKLPRDARPIITGFQTLQVVEATGVSDQMSTAFNRAAPSPTTIRLAAPTLTTRPASPANDQSPEVTGATPQGTAQVDIYTDAACAGPVATSGTAAAFASPGLTVAVADGSTTSFSARAVDAQGGASACSAGATYVELVPPAAPTLVGTDPMSPSGIGTPRVSGSAAAGTTVSLYATPDCSGAPAATGSAVEFASPGLQVAVASNSTTTFSSIASNAAGASPCSAPGATYTQDSTAPETVIDTGPSGSLAAPGFTFSSPDGAATFACRIDLAAFAPCTSPFTSGALADGGHAFEVRAIDTAGNVDATPATRTWTLDRAAPDTTITTGPAALTRLRAASFTFVASEPGSRFECSLDGATWTSCTSPMAYSALSGRVHVLRVRALDSAGNVDATPASRTWRVDYTLPTVTSFSPANLATTTDRTPTIRATVRDAVTNLTRTNIRLYVDGALLPRTAFAYDRATDRLTYTSPRVGAGRRTIRIVATDAAGNRRATSWYFTVR